MLSLISGKEKILSDCPPEKAFFFNNGITCRNLFDLADQIAKMEDKLFVYHVNKDHGKNDFADWIKQVLGDEVLFEKLQGILDKKKYVDVIRERIKELTSN
jgi:hypothetical protein